MTRDDLIALRERVRPILFSAPMARALLDGRKTQTRRVAPVQPPQECGINYMLGNESWLPVAQRTPVRRTFEAWGGELFRNRPDAALCGSFEIVPRIQPSDRLWVREAWRSDTRNDHLKPRDIVPGEPIWYDADGQGRNVADYSVRSEKGRPSIFLPRWASRLTLEVTEVRVERLNDCSEADAVAEGIRRIWGDSDRLKYKDCDAGPNYWTVDIDGASLNAPTAIGVYSMLWDFINGEGAWDTNPWVVVYTFTVSRGNVDALIEREAE